MADVVDQLTKIPGFMRAKGWNNGAALMDEWFAGAPNDKPDQGSPDTTTIKMDQWVLTFARAKEVFDAMVREKVWMNDAAKQALKLVLRRKGLLGPVISRFGNLSAPAAMVHPDQINFRVVGAGMAVYLAPLDDMYAALGRFAIYCAAQGQVSPLGPKQHQISIDGVGFYVRDSYDFNGDQDLGHWNFSTGDVGKLPSFGSDNVTNQNFRDWRTRNKKGGDFFVFSDIKILRMTPPQTFTVNE